MNIKLNNHKINLRGSGSHFDNIVKPRCNAGRGRKNLRLKNMREEDFRFKKPHYSEVHNISRRVIVRSDCIK